MMTTKYKYKNMSGMCCHKGRSEHKSKFKMPCVEEGCPYRDDCIMVEDKDGNV